MSTDDILKPYAAAAGAAAGAWLLLPVPLAAVLVAAAAFVWRPKALTALIVFAAAAGFLGGRAVDGLELPVTGALDGWVTLVDDPRSLGSSGIRVTVRYMGKRLEARAHGPVAARFDDALAGERLLVTGAVKPATGDWHRWRHVVGRLSLEAVHDRAPAAPLARFANGVRRLLARGAQGLPEDERSLFTGMVYGDDRNQSDRLADDFRAAGLGHLLVVSGQNVAFVLALASPLAGRLRPGLRLVALLAVLGVFATLTRFEPSVLRAVSMAAVAVTSAALGRPEQGRRTLAWAIAAVLVIDPFVVRMLAFQLSVSATAGILWITPPLAESLRGPRVLRLALATTAGAQLAVLPLLIAAFGTVPLVSLPANLLAGPASGPVMMWGLTAGFAAGLLGGWWAALVHWPTSMLLWWVRTVAAAAATMPPAVIGAGGAVAVSAGVLLVIGARWLAVGPRPSGGGGRSGGGGLADDGDGVPGSGDSELPSHSGGGGLADDGDGVGRRPSGGGGLSDEGDAESKGESDEVGVSPARGTVTWVRVLGAGVVAAAFAHSVAGAASPPAGWSSVSGVSLFSHDAAVVAVLDRPGPPRRMLESLRLGGVRRIDLIVAADGDAADAHAVLALTDRYRGAAVVAPPMHRVPRARTVTAGSVIDLGGLKALVTADSPRLEVEIPG